MVFPLTSRMEGKCNVDTLIKCFSPCWICVCISMWLIHEGTSNYLSQYLLAALGKQSRHTVPAVKEKRMAYFRLPRPSLWCLCEKNKWGHPRQYNCFTLRGAVYTAEAQSPNGPSPPRSPIRSSLGPMFTINVSLLLSLAAKRTEKLHEEETGPQLQRALCS